MKTTVLILAAAALAPFTGAIAVAKTTSGSIPVSAKIVTGNTVKAYLIGDQVLTTVRDNASRARSTPYGAVPLIRVNFESGPYFVKYVMWDKTNHKLTIDF